ncbi:MAG: hypothetical protein M1823_002635 [Watsoniomyces obsoletus]|nr:MAG: hypothetical protein M1823_002635 [Watsoniomyces obsoletus]
MPLKQMILGKRKASSPPPSSPLPPKPSKTSKTTGIPQEKLAEDHGIVQREFYPPEMTNTRALQYREGLIPRPGAQLDAALKATKEARNKIKTKDAVIHWFKMDLRLQDNTALHLAAQKAKEDNIPLICLYLISPQDYQAHVRAPARIDFMLRTLAIIRDDLAKLDIPLYIETVSERKKVPDRLTELAKRWGASHIYANIEYEVDELRRETKLVRKCLDQDIAFEAVHDACVVAPGELSSQHGNQYAVYSPWFRAWLAYCQRNQHVLDLLPPPEPNPSSARTRYGDLFEQQIPDAPENKRLTEDEKLRYTALWVAGEHEAQDRLNKFLDEKVTQYKDTRNFPAANSTAMLSVHFAAGTLSARTAVRKARDRNSTKKLDTGNPGIMNWVSEVAWRDFYKHVLSHWPYVCMNKPFKPEYTNIEWDYNASNFRAWCDGRTGYPIVDAAMRQMRELSYMHNRCRMIVASFLAKDLLLDWRMGERYFMEHLIDGDFASNNGGWGFAASTGVDPQPYFRIFNPILQSEKFDPQGEYIRKWIPELRDVKGKAIHDPYNRGEAKRAEKEGYPRMIVEHKFARERCLERYKKGIGRQTA